MDRLHRGLSGAGGRGRVRRRVWIGWLCGCLALALSPAARGEVERIENPAQPREGIAAVTLEELWRAGGEDDEVLFGVITQVLADSLGNFYLLDAQLSEVQVYSPEGQHLRTLSREGDGPGEIRNPADMFLLHGGEHLAMLQTFPGRAVIIDLEGNPVGGFQIGAADPSQGSFGVLITGRSAGDALVLGGIHMTFGGNGVSDQDLFLARHSFDGVEQTRYLTKSYQINYADFVISEAGIDFVWGNRWDIGPEERIFANPQRNAYEIEVYAADGTPERVIARAYESWQRDEQELAEARLVMEAVAQNYPPQPHELEILETAPDVSALHCRAGGELWVRSSRGDRNRSPGVLTTFDVFDAQGRFQRQLELHGPGDPNQDSIFLIGGDRVVLVTQALAGFRSMQGVASEEAAEAEETPMEVICFRLPG